MARWVRVLLGPLPATLLLLPLLFAGGVGALFALLATLTTRGISASERWSSLGSAGRSLAWVVAAAVGVLALWVVVLRDPQPETRPARVRWWLPAGLFVGLLAAGRWLWTMSAGGTTYGAQTWGVWLGLLAGPLVMGSYYFVRLLLRKEEP